MPASLREGGLFLTALCAPRSQGGLPVGCTLPLEGASLVVWFAGRPPVLSRPVELHPLGELLLSTVFQHCSGLDIDLHRGGLSCAHRALLRFSTTSTVVFQRVFLRAVCRSGAPAGTCAPP